MIRSARVADYARQKDQTEKREDFDFESFQDSAIAGLQSGQPLFGEQGLLKTLVKHLVEAALEGEMDAHLAEQNAADIANKRNGRGRGKTLRTDLGEIKIQTSRFF